MEHIVPFGVSIDDSAIQRRVEDSCVEAVKKKMLSCFFDNYSNPKLETEEIIKSWLDNHKDEVIKRAAEVIAEKMYKSTKVRQSIIAKCGEEVNDN